MKQPGIWHIADKHHYYRSGYSFHLPEVEGVTVAFTLKPTAGCVVAMLEKFTMGLERCNKAAAWASENEIAGDWEKVAVWYLRQYDSIWKTWVTTDAYTKIKAALADYGEIP